jgi:hypothetical protein
MDKLLVVNALVTPDGTRLESRSCYDFKQYVDANGNTYMVDGGLDYERRTAHGDEVDASLYLHEDDFEVIRDQVTWGTYGKNGDQPLQRVPVSELSDALIEAVLKPKSLHRVHSNFREVLMVERQYRIENNIKVEDE